MPDPVSDARHALACFRAEKEQARVKVEQANAEFLRASQGVLACMRKLKELGAE